MKKCPYCAEDIQDAAIVCKHCRSKIGNESTSRALRPSETRQPPKTPGWRVIALLGVAGVAAVIFVAQAATREALEANARSLSGHPTVVNRAPKVISIASTSDIDIGAGEMYKLEWVVPDDQPRCHLTGQIEVTSGGAKDVQVFLTSADEYKNLVNGHTAKSYIATDKTTLVNLDLLIADGGPKVVAVSNRFSTITRKRVQFRDIKATCT